MRTVFRERAFALGCICIGVARPAPAQTPAFTLVKPQIEAREKQRR